MCFAPQRRALFRHFFDIWTSKSRPRPSVFNTFDLEMCFAPQRHALFRHLNFPKVVREWCVFVHFDFKMCFAPQRRALFSTSQLPKVVRRWGVLLHFDLEMCFAPQRRALFRHLNFQKSSDAEVFCTFWLGNVLRATTACTFSTSQHPKVVRRWGVFVHFDLEMCFAPQRRALFRHLNFQKWSEPLVFCTFWLGNVLRATTACNFSSLIWPAGSAPGRFSEPTFRPSGASNHWKNTVFRDFPTFSRICIFFLLTLSLLIFSSSNLSLLSGSSLLCFSSVHIVGSLTSKLPSINNHLIPPFPKHQ